MVRLHVCGINCLYQMHGGVGEVGNDLNCLLLGHELDFAGLHLCKDSRN